jgi:Putative Flp pilus-assembly TadE/G-like
MTRHPWRCHRTFGVRGDEGQITAFVVVLFAGLFLFAGLVLDGGLALAGKVEAADVAQEAARTGTQQLQVSQLRAAHRARIDPGRAVQAALASVHAAGDVGQARVTGDAVSVQVTHRQRTQILSLIGIGDLVTTARATARAEQGITQPWRNEARP